MVNLTKSLKKKQAETQGKPDKSLPVTIEHKELNQVLDLNLEYIKENEKQPRRDYHQDKIQQLADSIETKGLIQPIVVLEISNKEFKIVAGHRRYRAYKLLNRESIPCIVDSVSANDDDLSERALVENLQRENLNPSEIAETIYKLKKKDNNIDDLIKITGYKRSSIFSYQKAYQNILDGKLTKEVLNKWGIKNINLKSESPTVGLKGNIDTSKLKLAKKNSKSFQKIVIKDTTKIDQLEEAKTKIERQLEEVQRILNRINRENKKRAR